MVLSWGIVIYFCVFSLIVIISSLISYPDIIRLRLKVESTSISKITSINIPVHILKVYVKKGSLVKKGQLLTKVIEDKSNHILNIIASQDGTINFETIVEPDIAFKENQEMFVIYPTKQLFYGIIKIPVTSINKIMEGQTVLINLDQSQTAHSHQLKGKISFIADDPTLDNVFIGKVVFNDLTQVNNKYRVKKWMVGSADIITQDASLLQRITKNLFKTINN